MKLFYILYFLFMPTLCFAYLDPGTGSLLVYALVGIASSVWFILKGVFYKFFIFLTSKFSSRKNKNVYTPPHHTHRYTIVFYSEGKKYFHVFEPVIAELCNRKINSSYITPDKNDTAFEIDSPYFSAYCPGSELVTISFMNNIKADIVISTTPHLDIYMWKRSKNVKKYIHIFHAAGGVDYYEKYALSFYDAIFSVGDFIKSEQTYLDENRNLPQKEYYDVGLPYYDKMLKNVEALPKRENEDIVLYAPTWGKDRSSFFKTGKKIVADLIGAGCTVIFRPHPQFYVSHKQELSEFLEIYKDNPKFILNNEPSPLAAMSKSDILISDYSGIVFDYAYLFQKPILLSTATTSFFGYEAEDLPKDIWFDQKAIQYLGHELSNEETENIANTVKNVLSNKSSEVKRIMNFRNENLYNFGSAGISAANAIEDIYKGLQK